ncbi:MAG: GNAT family N-acetyltransferase [Haloarculaceae archaeon]
METEHFPTPPDEFTDDAGRHVAFRRCDSGDFEPLDGMYAGLSAESRVQGIPPVDDDSRREWVGGLLDEEHNVAAWHGDDAVGHAALLPMDDDRAELVIFVADEYQEAGIGSRLLRVLLGHGRENGFDRVWLTVQRDNWVARNLYRSVGFTVQSRGREWEMELALSGPG